MRIWYLKKLLNYLNTNFNHITTGEHTTWILKDKVIAIWDNGDLEVLWDIFKEGVLKP
jgi:hypothetical protein